MSRRFRVTANFPILGQNAHQTVIVEGSNWQVALGKAAREYKKLPIMHRRRVTALSMMVEQIGAATDNNDDNNQLPEGQAAAGLVSEQTVMEGPTVEELEPTNADYAAAITEEAISQEPVVEDGEALNQQANDEAERLIADGDNDILDIEE
jgi:hypothetical protein